MDKTAELTLNIMQLNYWEHFKYAKDLALVYHPSHPKRIQVEKILNSLITKINKLKKTKDGNNNKNRSNPKD